MSMINLGPEPSEREQDAFDIAVKEQRRADQLQIERDETLKLLQKALRGFIRGSISKGAQEIETHLAKYKMLP